MANIRKLFNTLCDIITTYPHSGNTVDTCWDCNHFYKPDRYCEACFRNKGDYFDPIYVKEEEDDQTTT